MTCRPVIVGEQAADLGGLERVVQALLEYYPDATALAPHFAATNRPEGYRAPWDGRTRLVGSGRGRRRSYLAPLYARRLRRAGVLEADAVVSVTHSGWSHAVRVAPSTPHICYCSGLPTHLYEQTRYYLNDQPWVARPALAAAIPALRAFDRRLMRRPGRLVAGSEFSARQLERVHGRQMDVVYPPVRTNYFIPGTTTDRDTFLMVARLVSSKRVDIVLEAFRSLDERLVVVGDGPRLQSLRRVAPPNVTFVGACDDPALLRHYRASRALICPSVETFGIAMGEAQACGIPVIGAREGGAPEVVRHRVTGILLERPDPRSIAETVRAFDTTTFQQRACRESAARFSEDRFHREFDRVLAEERSAVRELDSDRELVPQP